MYESTKFTINLIHLWLWDEKKPNFIYGYMNLQKKRGTNPRAILHLRLKGVKAAKMHPGDFKSQKIDIHQPVDKLKKTQHYMF